EDHSGISYNQKHGRKSGQAAALQKSYQRRKKKSQQHCERQRDQHRLGEIQQAEHNSQAGKEHERPQKIQAIIASGHENGKRGEQKTAIIVQTECRTTRLLLNNEPSKLTRSASPADIQPLSCIVCPTLCTFIRKITFALPPGI